MFRISAAIDNKKMSQFDFFSAADNFPILEGFHVLQEKKV